MSRKKNTLKDLDEFLKQQAATLVNPTPLSEKVGKEKPVKKEAGVRAEKASPEIQKTPAENVGDISSEKLLKNLIALADQQGELFRHTLYELIIRVVESRGEYSPEDRMLINTALYLKSGDQWKDIIREYWRNKALRS